MEIIIEACFFCDSFHDISSIFISEYNGIMICYECIINHNKPISIHDNIDCSVCYENNKGIELSNCNHIICINCYKNIYFGFISEDILTTAGNPINSKKPKKREDIFTVKESFHNSSRYYDFSQPLIDLLEEVYTNSNMKTKEFIEYETAFVTHCKKQYNLDLQDIQFYNHKASNIMNMNCPLCRK